MNKLQLHQGGTSLPPQPRNRAEHYRTLCRCGQLRESEADHITFHCSNCGLESAIQWSKPGVLTEAGKVVPLDLDSPQVLETAA